MAVNQQAWGDEDRATVLALDMQGYGGTEISRRTGVPLATVKRWVSRWANVTPEQRDERLLTAATELALRFQELQHKLADAYEDLSPAELLRHGANINNAMGTNMDKALAISGKSAGQNVGPFVIAIFPGETPTIEGEVQHIE